MKTSSLTSLLAAATMWLGSAVISHAQEPVSTGTIQGLVPWAGTLTLRSDQTQRPMTFYGVDRANIFSADGQAAGIGDLQPGMKATVQYAVRGKKWYISKVMLSDQRPASVVGVPIYPPALTTRAANDGDITTQPANNAAYDNDRTTQPANNAAYDNDRTTQPGSYYNNRIPVRRRNP